MTRTGAILSCLTGAAMLALSADGSAIAQQSQKPKPKPRAGTYGKTLTFTLSTTTPSKPGKSKKLKK